MGAMLLFIGGGLLFVGGMSSFVGGGLICQYFTVPLPFLQESAEMGQE